MGILHNLGGRTLMHIPASKLERFHRGIKSYSPILFISCTVTGLAIGKVSLSGGVLGYGIPVPLPLYDVYTVGLIPIGPFLTYGISDSR